MKAVFEMIQSKQDGKRQQQFKMVNGPASSADLARGMRALFDSLEKSGQMVEGATLTLTLQS